MAVRHCLAGGARRFVPSAESGGSCVLSAGAGFLLYLLLFLLYIDYADIYRIFVYCRIRVRVLQEAALIVGGIPLSLRQLRTKDRDERRLSALRGNQRVGIPFLPKGFVPLSAKTCNAVRCLPGWDVLSA